MHILARSVILACAVTACAHPRHFAQPVYTPVPGPVRRPFSEVVRVGRTLYLSGQLGTDSSGHLVSGGIKGETKQVLENIKHVLEENGSSMDEIVKCTAMLADINEWAAMNEVYVTYFPNHVPARSAFATNGLVMGGRVEIECMAVSMEKTR